MRGCVPADFSFRSRMFTRRGTRGDSGFPLIDASRPFAYGGTTMKSLLLSISLVFLAICGANSADARGGLTTIANPGGGKIMYGHVDGARDEASAMSVVLRAIHNQCGNRPVVGKVFQVRGTGSVAVFFTVVNRSAGNKRIAGLLIAAPSAVHRVDAALVTDETAHLGSTINPMLRKLFAVWHPGAASRVGQPQSAAQTAPALHRVTAGDGSASALLPAGWTMNPISRYGTIVAAGPNGERAVLGSALGAMDVNNPIVRRTEAFAQGAGRNTSYARALYYPYGNDMADTFVTVWQRSRQNLGAGPAEMTVTSAVPIAGPAPPRCAHILGRINPGDGPRGYDVIFCSGAVSRMGQYMNFTSIVTVPDKYADRERVTADAVLNGFSVDMDVVQGQANRFAAPEIARINAIGRAAAQQAAAAHVAEDRQAASVERHWDSQDRGSQAFSNYLLDQTVIQDNSTGTHATAWNTTASAMVSSDPNRYEYVATPNYWKGVDY